MTSIDSFSRRFVLLMAGTALALSACGGGDSSSSTAASGGGGEYTVADDYILGNANAPVTLVEYASPFPAGEPQMAQAGHKLALCADRTKFYKNIKLQFDRQSQIMEMGRRPNGLRQAYISLAKASGLSEQEFISCMSDVEVSDRYDAFIELGADQGVTGTPTVFINGKRTKSDFDSIQAAIAPILGEPIPEKAEAE